MGKREVECPYLRFKPEIKHVNSEPALERGGDKDRGV
jgi:hypothetical protein